MEISIEHKDGKYPSFNVHLSSKAGADPFLTIRGCRIVDGSKGQFVSYPSRKQDDGKYWNHIWANDKFNAMVLEKATAGKKPSKSSDDDDIPF
jgi:DNA-binding cell septation regulator SpoVG